jgi:hypothetical protein
MVDIKGCMSGPRFQVTTYGHAAGYGQGSAGCPACAVEFGSRVARGIVLGSHCHSELTQRRRRDPSQPGASPQVTVPANLPSADGAIYSSLEQERLDSNVLRVQRIKPRIIATPGDAPGWSNAPGWSRSRLRGFELCVAPEQRAPQPSIELSSSRAKLQRRLDSLRY